MRRPIAELQNHGVLFLDAPCPVMVVVVVVFVVVLALFHSMGLWCSLFLPIVGWGALWTISRRYHRAVH